MKIGIGSQIKFVFVHASEYIPKYLLQSLEFIRFRNPNAGIELVITENNDKQTINYITNNLHIEVIQFSIHKYSSYLNSLDLNYPKQKGNVFWFSSAIRLLLVEEWASSRLLNDEPFIHLESDCLYFLDEIQTTRIFKNKTKIYAPFDRDGRCVPSIIYFPNSSNANKLANFVKHEFTNPSEDWPEFYYSDQEQLSQASKLNLIAKLPTEPSERTLDFYLDDYYVVFDPAYLGQYVFGKDPRHNRFIRKSGMVNSAGDTSFSHSLSWAVDYATDTNRNITISYLNSSYLIANLHNYAKRLNLESDLTSLVWKNLMLEANHLKSRSTSLELNLLWAAIAHKFRKYFA